MGKTTTRPNLAAPAAVGPTVVVEFDLAVATTVDFLAIDCAPDVDVTLRDVVADAATVASATYEAPGDIDLVPCGTTLEG